MRYDRDVRGWGTFGVVAALVVATGCGRRCPERTHLEDGRCVAGVAAEKLASNEAEPGFLVVVCNPGCDEILDNGASLGKSPVVKAPVRAGGHHLEMRNGAVVKAIDVDVKPGETHAERVAMEAP